MIKINILKDFTGGSSEDLVQIEEQENIKINLIKRIFVIALGPLALFGYESYNIPILEQNLANLEADLAKDRSFNEKKQALTAEIAKWKKNQVRLDKQIEFLRLIEDERHVSRDIILQLQKIIPDQVWIKSINTENKNLTIEGEGVDQADILEFNRRLESLSFLRDVTLPAVNPMPAGSSGIVTYNYKFKAEIDNTRGKK
jgi:Tfp pilus assembly protein PilN